MASPVSNKISHEFEAKERIPSGVDSAIVQVARMEFPANAPIRRPGIIPLVSLAMLGSALLLLIKADRYFIIMFLLCLGVLTVIHAVYRRNREYSKVQYQIWAMLDQAQKDLAGLAGFMDRELAPLERMYNSGKSIPMVSMPAEKNRIYFMLVQIRTALRDRSQKLKAFTARYSKKNIRHVFEMMRKAIAIHEGVMAKSRVLLPIENIEATVTALLTELNPADMEQYLSEEILDSEYDRKSSWEE